MNKNGKAEIVSQIKELFENSTGVYLVDYHGVNVEDINNLRKEFRKEGVTYKVFKNTLIKRAIDELGGYENFNDSLVGMNALAFTGENFVAPAKIIKKYFKEKKKLVFKGCYLESQYYDSEKLDVLASMPSKEELISSIIGSIASPASGIVGAINAVMRDIVSLVDEISKKKAA